MGFAGNLLGFPAVKEFRKSVKNLQRYSMSLVYDFWAIRYSSILYHFRVI